MALRLEAVTFEVADARAVAAFWADLLEREVLAESGGALVSGDQTQVGLRFVTSDTDQVGPRRLHLHLTSSGPSRRRCAWVAATLTWAKGPTTSSSCWLTRVVTSCA